MIIDSHFHLGYMSRYFNYDLKLESVLRLMDKLGISYAVNSHCLGLVYGDLERSMQENVDTFNSSGGRIMSYYVFDPTNVERSLKVIDENKDRKIFKGIKIHPSFHGISADDERYRAVWEYALKNGLPILAHTWNISLTNPVQKLSYPSVYEDYIKKYPGVTLILGHSGGRSEGIKEAARLGRVYSNVYCDTAGDIYANCFLEYLVSQVGSCKILFGTDYSMMDQRNMLGVVMGADITIDEKENIFYNNAAKLFKIDTHLGGGRDE